MDTGKNCRNILHVKIIWPLQEGGIKLGLLIFTEHNCTGPSTSIFVSCLALSTENSLKGKEICDDTLAL
jgi:hypothetical protein